MGMRDEGLYRIFVVAVIFSRCCGGTARGCAYFCKRLERGRFIWSSLQTGSVAFTLLGEYITARS